MLEDRLQRSQNMETMGQLASGISYDFDNLLTVISAYALFELEDPAITPGARAAVAAIATAAESAMGLTRQLLTFSRKSLSQFRLLDLGSALGNVTRMLGRVISTDIELKVPTEPDPRPVNADLGMIEQIVLNLALNARDAMPDGGES
ncbi:MAG: sensor protein [Bryobacterales bacterium]|nr:sensor protein [Bryobacterales bacterium]